MEMRLGVGVLGPPLVRRWRGEGGCENLLLQGLVHLCSLL